MNVKVGQLWADNDSREKSTFTRQHLRVVGIADDLPGRHGPGPFAHLNNEDTGIDTWVRVSRMKPTSNGYRLVEDVE